MFIATIAAIVIRSGPYWLYSYIYGSVDGFLLIKNVFEDLILKYNVLDAYLN